MLNDALELLQDFGGTGDRGIGALDMDLVVAGRDRNVQNVADLSQMLIASSKQRQERFGIDHRNACFSHQGMYWRRRGAEPSSRVLLVMFIPYLLPDRPVYRMEIVATCYCYVFYVFMAI